MLKHINISGKVDSVEKSVINLNNLIEQYKQECSDTIKKGIDCAAYDLIKRCRYKSLLDKKSEIESRKISWFGRLRKLDKLQAVELENIHLQMQDLEITEHSSKDRYSIHDTLADLRAFSISELGGQKTPEMTDFETMVKRFFKVDEQTINNLAYRKAHAHPMVVESTKKKEKTSHKISRLSEKNRELQNNISRNNNWRNSNKSYESRQTVNTQITKAFRTIEQTSSLPNSNKEDRQADNSIELS